MKITILPALATNEKNGVASARDNDNSESIIFQRFRNYRNELARRIASQNPNYSGIIDSTGFPEGYGAASQDVIIPSFLAAYSGLAEAATVAAVHCSKVVASVALMGAVVGIA